MGFSRQEYWNGLPCPPPGDLPNPGIETVSPALQVGPLSLGHRGSPIYIYVYIYLFFFRFFSHIGYYRILSGVPCGHYFRDPVRRGMTQGSPARGLLKQCYPKFGPRQSLALASWGGGHWEHTDSQVPSQTTESGTQGGAQDSEWEPASLLLTHTRVQTHSSENHRDRGGYPLSPGLPRRMLLLFFLLTLLWALATGSMYIFPSCLHPTEISPEAFLTFFISPPTVPHTH